MLDTKRYKEIVDSFKKQLTETREETASIKLADDKWSLKEIIGHLIDSASNNHQRFVRLQADDLLGFPAYEGEEWIRIQKYNNMSWDVLITLWYNYNCLLLNIVDNINPETYGNVWVKDEDVIPLEQLIKDYYKHLEIHIEHFRNRMGELRIKLQKKRIEKTHFMKALT